MHIDRQWVPIYYVNVNNVQSLYKNMLLKDANQVYWNIFSETSLICR